jgi:hypothetical protein
MSVCEYYDPEKGRVQNRNYIVYLQHKAAELERELEQTMDHDSLDSKETEQEKAKSPEQPTPASPSASGDPRYLINANESH